MQKVVHIDTKLPVDIAAIDDVAPVSSSPTVDYCPFPSFEDLLTRITEFSREPNPIGLLLGGMGSGKTTLLSMLAKMTHCVAIPVEQGKLNFEGSLAYVGVHLDKQAGIDSLGEFIAHLSPTDGKILLLIDNAHQLSMAALKAMFNYLKAAQNNKFHVLLAGKEILSHHIALLCEQEDYVLPISFSLKPLSYDETKSYLAHISGYGSKTRAISEADLAYIFKLSEGYPGRIKRVSAQYRYNVTYKSKGRKLKEKSGFSFVNILIGMAIVSLLGVLGQQIVTQINSKTAMKSQTQIKAPVATQNTKTTQPAPPSFIASIEGLPEEAIVPVVAQLAMTAHIPQPKKIIKTQPQVRPVADASHGYTIQLIAGYEKANLLQWSRKMHLQKQVAIHKVQRFGHDWYVLTSGEFSTPQAARAVIASLPAELQEARPWVRPKAGLY